MKQQYSKSKDAKRQKDNHLRRIYGIGIDIYNKMFDLQNGRCLICNKHQTELSKPLGVDHNHTTDKIRGLLCSHCNLVIGNAFDDPIILKNAIFYLYNSNKHNDTNVSRIK